MCIEHRLAVGVELYGANREELHHLAGIVLIGKAPRRQASIVNKVKVVTHQGGVRDLLEHVTKVAKRVANKDVVERHILFGLPR